MNLDDILAGIEGEDESFREPRLPKPEEIVIDDKGRIRQAGTVETSAAHSEYIRAFRELCERDLFSFAKGVMGMSLLSKTLHRGVCQWLQATPPRRKLLLLPRDHLKTSIVGRSLGPHMLIQPQGANIYFPGCQDKNCRYRRSESGDECYDNEHLFDGCNTRVLLGYETATNAQAQLRWIAGQWESNELLRALWPHRVWENARKQSSAWNQERIIIPRNLEYPEPSIDTIGVGGAVTGRHYAAHVFDDLCTLEAANSVVVMNATIEWFKASRALLDDPTYSLEFTIGTRWAVHDLYEYIMREDHTVETKIRAIIEDGKIIFPEVFTPEAIAHKRKLFGSLFPLLYMNSAADPTLVDFDCTQLRGFRYVNQDIEFDLSAADEHLARDYQAPSESPPEYLPGTPYADVIRQARAAGHDELMQLRHGRVRAC